MRNLEHCILVRLMGETGETSKCDDLGSSCIGETDEAINVRILEPYILVRLVRLSKLMRLLRHSKDEDLGTSCVLAKLMKHSKYMRILNLLPSVML